MLTEQMRHFDLLAQGSGDWENILFLVIVGFFWLAGALAKTLSARKGTAQQQRSGRPTPQAGRPRETWQQRLARKAQEMQQAAQAERQRLEPQTQERTQQTRPRPAGEISVRTDTKGDSVMVYQPPAVPQERSAVRPRPAKPAVAAVRQQITIEPPKPLEPPQAALAVSSSAVPDGHSLAVVDSSDPDALKRAILHYEIFGKPLALRDPSQEAAVF